MNLHALAGLDRDLQQSLLRQIRDFWTRSSTALEGNTLTLARYELAIGPLTSETGVWPAEAEEAPLRAFCQRSQLATLHLFEQANDQQARRNLKHNGGGVE
jgi:hypothetical protein